MPKVAAAVLGLVGVLAIAIGSGMAEDRRPYAERKEVQPHSGLSPCSSRLAPVRSAEFSPGQPATQQLQAELGAGRFLGVEENVEVVRAAGGEAVFLRVHYPEGSYNFSSANEKTPLGGAAFYAPVSDAPTICLHYKVRFPDGFDFVKGGKLPGLYAGEAPSGGEKVSGRDGWSVRLMWRKEGQGELYEYVYNKKGKYGLSAGRGLFSFPTGRWVAIDLEVVRNDAGERNGRARLWIDGTLVIEQDDIVFSTEDERQAQSGLMFSTFFGGGSKSWASPRHQHVDFCDIRLYAGDED